VEGGAGPGRVGDGRHRKRSKADGTPRRARRIRRAGRGPLPAVPPPGGAPASLPAVHRPPPAIRYDPFIGRFPPIPRHPEITFPRSHSLVGLSPPSLTVPHSPSSVPQAIRHSLFAIRYSPLPVPHSPSSLGRSQSRPAPTPRSNPSPPSCMPTRNPPHTLLPGATHSTPGAPHGTQFWPRA
jgi:hypothetical protein